MNTKNMYQKSYESCRSCISDKFSEFKNGHCGLIYWELAAHMKSLFFILEIIFTQICQLVDMESTLVSQEERAQNTESYFPHKK